VVYDYSFTNFKRKIELDEIAAIAGISPNSFCRYFKARTKKTYSQFIIEIKVGYACKLLIDNKYSVKQICYESGFNNFASFHKYFKQITNKSPLDYKKEFITA
jgi:AraC-like DNA-binding protein